MIFNTPGKFFKEYFTLNGNTLDPVQSFCYLGFDVKCSGIVTHVRNILNDKGNKALKPLLTAIRTSRLKLQLDFFTLSFPQSFYTMQKTGPL